MELAEIKWFLENGRTLGFTIETDDEHYLGWLLISKIQPNFRVLEIVGADDEHRARQELYREKQYQVRVVQLNRTVHDSGDYETNEDYRINECFHLSSLAEVEAFLGKFGKRLSEIRPSSQIDSP